MDTVISVASILLVLSAIAVGVVSAVVTTWSLRARLYSLEDRVNIVEGVTQREVKIRAAEGRFKRATKDEEAIAAALSAQPQATPARPWWDLPGVPRSYSGK